MTFRIALTPHAALDVRGMALLNAVRTLGIQGVNRICVTALYFVRGPLNVRQLTHLCEAALADPAAHSLAIGQPGDGATHSHSVEVSYLPGVMDPLALQLVRAAVQIGLPSIEVVTGTRYELYGEISTPNLILITERLLHLSLIHI